MIEFPHYYEGTKVQNTMKKVALQLFSLREISKGEGLRETLKTAAELGYNGVEFAGYFGLTIDEIKEELKKNNLEVCGAHIGYAELFDNYEATVAGLKELGAYCVCVPHAKFETAEEWAEFGKKLNELGKKLRADGLLFGYHNHAHEFVEYDGKRAIDILLENSEPENVFFEFDTRHCAIAKENPVTVAMQYSGRIPVLHARDTDMTSDCAVGSGVVDFKSVDREANGINWFVVEYDGPNTVEDLRKSAEFLKALC